MSNRQTTIAIDAMGGEKSPYKVLKGSDIFSSKNPNVKLIFFGVEDQIISEINKNNSKIKKK